jgi:hypothetical protein
LSLFKKELNRLVESFGHRLAELKSADYNETKLRDDSLNPPALPEIADKVPGVCT